MTAKPTVLVFAFDLLAHYTRCLRVAELLADDLTFLFQESDYDGLVRRQGFTTFPCQRLAEKELVARGCRDDVMNWPRAELEAVMLAQSDAIEQHHPDFVIGDMSPTLSMASEKTGVPYVSIANAYLSRHCDAPFTMPDCLPNITADIVDVPPFYREKLADRDGFIAVARSQKEFRFLRRRHGLTKKLNLALELEGDQTWICDLGTFHPLKAALPATVREIGPLRFFPKNVTAGESPIPQPGRPTVLVTMGSSGNYDRLHQLRDPLLQDFDFLVCGQEPVAGLPPNVRHVPFADFNDLMPRVDLVLCHGGNGSLYQALAAGKPALCFPSFFEQRFNAEQLAANGWGANLPAEISTEELLAALHYWSRVELGDVRGQIAAWEARQPALLRGFTEELLPVLTPSY
ncbi:MAG: glycosyltransferase [Bacteroidota bacterium]